MGTLFVSPLARYALAIFLMLSPYLHKTATHSKAQAVKHYCGYCNPH